MKHLPKTNTLPGLDDGLQLLHTPEPPYYAVISTKIRQNESNDEYEKTMEELQKSVEIFPVYALKRLLNHKMTSDVTAGYVVMDVERLRKPMQMITDYILKLTGVKDTNNVISLSKKRIKGAWQ